MSLFHTRPWLSLVAVAIVSGVVAGSVSIGVASIPDGSGLLHGCYQHATGVLRLVDSTSNGPVPGRGCLPEELSVSWNQQGPQGVQGPQGLQGPQGPQGPAGIVPDTAVVLFARVDTEGDGSNLTGLHLDAGKGVTNVGVLGNDRFFVSFGGHDVRSCATSVTPEGYNVSEAIGFVIDRDYPSSDTVEVLIDTPGFLGGGAVPEAFQLVVACNQ